MSRRRQYVFSGKAETEYRACQQYGQYRRSVDKLQDLQDLLKNELEAHPGAHNSPEVCPLGLLVFILTR